MTSPSRECEHPPAASPRSLATLDLDRTPAGHHLTAAIARAAGLRGLPVLLVPGGDTTDPRHHTPRTPAPELLLGLIVISDPTGQIRVPPSLQTTPTVIVDLTGAGPPNATVRIDRPQSAARLVGHLQQLGHRHIGYLGPRADSGPDRWRRPLARELILADLFDPDYFLAETPDGAGGRAGTRQLLRRSPPPSVIVCHNGRLAIGVHHAVAENPSSVPHNVSVIALDDTDVGPIDLRPPLDALHTPYLDLATQSVQTLLDLSHGCIPPTVSLTCDLVTRSSSAHPSPQAGPDQGPDDAERGVTRESSRRG